MIIGACGFGSTGSSTVTDYLKEYDQIMVKDDLEFNWISKPDGLIDLERALMNPHNRTSDSIVAIRRFEALVKSHKFAYQLHGLSGSEFEKISKQFIDAITMVKWFSDNNSIKKGYTVKYLTARFMKKKIIPRIEKRTGQYADCWPLREVKLSIRPQNFYEEAGKYVNRMLEIMGLDTNSIIALDQPFAGNNPQACFPFYKDPYAVIVDRDPRDNYVFARTRMLGKFHYMPINKVEDFITYYRSLRKDQPYLEKNPRILRIRFEEMIYEYDRTTQTLRDFLHLPENQKPRSVFDPDLSIANTQVFKRFPQFKDDVRKIERELEEYLFDFSKYPEPDKTKKMFYGKSPKHEAFKKIYSE